MNDRVVVTVDLSLGAANLLASLEWEDESLKKLSQACQAAVTKNRVEQCILS